jgi:hypothetical protein
MHASRVLTCAMVLSVASAGGAQVSVTIDTGTQYQTILGWGGATPGDMTLPDLVRNQALDALVDDLGLNRLRYEGPGGNRAEDRRWEWLNDDADPDHIDWSAFNTASLDARAAAWLVPFKQRVEARGEPFDLYVSPSFFDGGSTGSAPAWLLNSPGENAEFATSLLLRLRDVHGVTANYYCILNEAGNNNAWTAPVVARAIKTLGPRLQALGLPTRIQFPESISADVAWDSYINPLLSDPDVWPCIGCLSYHLYGSNGKRGFIRDLGIAKGIPTAQTEYMGLTTQHLYLDMIMGGVSYWELYGLMGHGSAKIDTNRDNTHFGRGTEYWTFRQAMHYVRPGDVRVEATSSLSYFYPLAFSRGGRVTVVLLNNISPVAARTVNFSGLPAGQYGLCQSVLGAAYSELGLRTVGTDGALAVDVPAYAVMTLYPYGGVNQPPTITAWQALPDYLTAPASSTTLGATATDPELDALSYGWSVKSVPAGASVVLGAPGAASCLATGLTVAGDYIFQIAVGDASHTVTRDLMLRVHAGNEPPVPVDVHNRAPVQVVLPQTSTNLRGGAWDLENDPLTYKWTVASQPAGAGATVAAPNSASTALNGLTVAGEYLLRLEIKDPTHTVTQDLIVPVYADPYPPVINGVTVEPANPHAGRTVRLSAATSDQDGDAVTHWWTVKSNPAGTQPVFDSPGHACTDVSGLTAAGTYVFTLTAIDLSHTANRDVTVTVGAKLSGDADANGMVNILDVVVVVNAFGASPGEARYDSRADLDGSGTVDVADLLMVVNNYGAT